MLKTKRFDRSCTFGYLFIRDVEKRMLRPNYSLICVSIHGMSKILLIDDDSINNFVNKELIKRKFPDVDIMCYENPVFAINFLSDEKAGSPDLILLDLNMPLLNGWEFLDRMIELSLELPVAILTSSINQLDKEKSAEYENVKAFLVKPIDLEKLDSLLSVYQ